MASLDDLPLDPRRGNTDEGPPSAPSSPGPRVVLIGVIAALVLGAGIWFYGARQRTADTTAGAAAAASPSAAARALTDPAPVAPVLPPLGEMDPYVRALFATLATHPELLKWLATDDLVGALALRTARGRRGHR
jgi:hypothetical protein